MFYDRLHAWLLTQSRLTDLLTSIIASLILAGRPKAALLLCFFCDFRNGDELLLFIVILVTYEYKNR